MKITARILVRPAIVLVCAFIPPMVTNRHWWFIGRTRDGYGEPFEVLGMLVCAALLFYGLRAWRTPGPGRIEAVVRAVVVGMVMLHIMLTFVNYPGVSWDYRCYDAAAHNVSNGVNPYNDTAYLYPPLLAQCLAAVHAMVQSTTLFEAGEPGSWWLVFYFYEVLLLLLLFLLAELAFGYARRAGMPVLWAGAVVLLAFIANAPLFRTYLLHQTNGLVLLAVLYSMMRLRERPVRCGVLMAVAVMVKPQGILFPVLWFMIGARRAVLGFLAATAVLVVAQAGFGTDWTPWRQFFASLAHVPQSNNFFRNQSLYSLFSTVLRTAGIDVDRTLLLLVVRVCSVGILGWFVWRFVDREKRIRAAAPAGEADLLVRVGGHSVDMVMLALFCSPLVWGHHYAIAIPAVLWIVALTRGRIPAPALLGLVLMFVPTTFDVWFFSYHRIAGAVLFVVTMSPERTIDLYRAAVKRPYPSPGADAV